jgi:hypothetical protein
MVEANSIIAKDLKKEILDLLVIFLCEKYSIRKNETLQYIKLQCL